MPSLHCNPDSREYVPGLPFVQVVELREDGGELLARGLWHAAAELPTAQILELHVNPAHRRRGHGGRVVERIVGEVTRLNALRPPALRIRAVWLVLAQVDHLPARGFLTRHSFHHVATSKHLYLAQDAMMYARALD